MSNELLLIITLIVEYSAVVLMYKFLGKDGLYLWTVLATITANIEVLILVKAFGMEMTLGNVLFATTFLVTDIASEIFGKKDANKAVKLGIATSISFVIISASWLWYSPSANDFASPAIKTVFSNTPRLMIASLAVYVIVQFFDVWLYHKWWNFTNKKSGNKERFLWLRNNGSTLISQFVNSVLYTIFAFAGVYDVKTVITLICSTYIIYIVTSLCDTPFVYICRSIAKKRGDLVN